MENQKKLQVFISSTYTDLLEERQTAVEAVLEAGHIPAGMELFAASDKSQWEIIERWIDESDIYLLILGGRYGSIEKTSGKSYTHLEYEYAQSKNKPLFAIVINEDKLSALQVKDSELVNPNKLKDFREIVLQKMSSFFSDNKDIKLEIHRSLNRIRQDYRLSGWIRGNEENSDFAKEIMSLNDEIRKLREENEKLKAEQVERSPKLEISINESQHLEFKLNVDIHTLYKKQEPIEHIPEHLTDYLSQKEVDDYNRSLSNVSESDIADFNEVQTKIHSLITSQERFEVNLYNIGNIKANNIHINITFPDLVLVADSQKEISSAIDELNEMLLQIIPKYDSDLIGEAEARLSDNIRIGSVEHTMSIIDKIKFSNSYSSADYHNLSLPKVINKNNYDSVKDNTITIVTPELMHSLKSNYKNYILVPLKKGTGIIRVEVICEEYLQTTTYEIPITIK